MMLINISTLEIISPRVLVSTFFATGVSRLVTHHGIHGLPGAPIIFGTTFKIARMLGFEKDMKSLYFMCWGCFYFIFDYFRCSLCIYTKLVAMLLAAFVLGYSPPLQDWHYGKIFANSEVGIFGSPGFSYLFYALGTKAFWKIRRSLSEITLFRLGWIFL